MSSIAVLTQESFAEHRSGLVPQQIKGDSPACSSRYAYDTLPCKPLSSLLTFSDVLVDPVGVG